MGRKTLLTIAAIGLLLTIGGIAVIVVKKARKKRAEEDAKADQGTAGETSYPSQYATEQQSAQSPAPVAEQYPFPWREGDNGGHILALQRSINKGWDLYKLKATEAGRQVPNPKCKNGKPTFPLAENGSWDACTTLAIKYISGNDGWVYLTKARYDLLKAKLKALQESFGNG